MSRTPARAAAVLLTGGLALGLSACGGADPEPVEVDTTTTHTLADVEQHADTDDCWVVVDGGVYDVTGWIGQHPGGAARIESVCGTDATDEFLGEHATSSTAQDTLARYQVGVLG